MSTTDPVADLTFGSLAEVIAGLRGLADKLAAEYTGQDGAWGAQDALAGHQLLVLAQSQVSGVRALHAAAARRAGVIRLDDHRPC